MEWERLYERHAAGLLLYARQWFRDTTDAEDVVQDGFVRCWRAWRDGRLGEDRETAALYAHVRYAALDRLRSGQRRKHREERAAERLYGDGTSWFECSLGREELASAVEQVLAALPDEQREVVVMRIWGGLKHREIAESLNIPLNTAAARYRYGLAALRRNLPEVSTS